MWEPFGPEQSNITTSWRSGPNERGTLNIMSTCFITLILCTYTSLHLSIPEAGRETWYQVLWRKTGWQIVGIFAPDFVSLLILVDTRN
jgi:hypothetical protein